MHRTALILCCILSLTLSRPVGFTLIKGRRNGSYINFEFIATNLNAELHSSIGAFRCAIPGLYFFTFTALSPKYDHMKISFRKNRKPVTTVYASGNAHSSASCSMALWLRRGDIVYPFIEDGDFVESRARSRALIFFSGFKVNGKVWSSSENYAEDSPEMESDALLRDDDSEFFPVESDVNDQIEQLFDAGRAHL